MVTRSFYENLEFDLSAKLLEEIVALFNNMPSAPLDNPAIDLVDEAQGVYQLLLDNELVYIGKTDSEDGLRSRLLRHSKKIQCRVNLDVNAVTFKAVRVYVFTPMDLEKGLIAHYLKPNWQHSGFGANDPGKNRDTSRVKPDHFDAQYPIKLDVLVNLSPPNGMMSAADMLHDLKDRLPYNLRYQTTGHHTKPHSGLVNTQIQNLKDEDTVFNYLQAASRCLGKTWQITALPGYIIVYKESAPNKYPSGTIIS